jgi:hypothetical protein
MFMYLQGALDEDDTPVIPGEHRETRNPGGVTTGQCLLLLDASFRWHDELTPSTMIEMKHYSAFTWGYSPTLIPNDSA